MGLIYDDAVPLTKGSKEDSCVFSSFDDASIPTQFLIFLRLKDELVIGGQGTESSDDDVVAFQLSPRDNALLVVENEHRQLMPPRVDVAADFSPPLIHESLRTDNQGRMTIRVGCRTGSHKCDGLDGLTKTHIIGENTSFMLALFLSLHPGQSDLLVFHQGHFERAWLFIPVCLGGLLNMFDAFDQVLDVFREM